jgi:hypothetical protein
VSALGKHTRLSRESVYRVFFFLFSPRQDKRGSRQAGSCLGFCPSREYRRFRDTLSRKRLYPRGSVWLLYFGLPRNLFLQVLPSQKMPSIVVSRVSAVFAALNSSREYRRFRDTLSRKRLYPRGRGFNLFLQVLPSQKMPSIVVSRVSAVFAALNSSREYRRFRDTLSRKRLYPRGRGFCRIKFSLSL